MQAQVKWVDAVHFEATSGTGHTTLLDGPEDSGGKNRGARPMELVLMGLGGCASFDVVTILEKTRSQVTGCETQVTAVRSTEVPMVFESIDLHFTVRGVNLDAKKVARAVSLSADKYCSASIMLSRGGVKIQHTHSIENDI